MARYTAQQFADEQTTLHKARRVFLNTLSVWAVHDYLTLMNVPTALTEGDSWNPLLRCCTDIADLVMPGLGRIECRPLFDAETSIYIPPETWWERLAYIMVRLHPSYTEATLLGVLFRAEQVEVAVESLHGIDELLEYLHQIGRCQAQLSGKYVILRNWLDERYPDDWIDARALLTPANSSFVFRWKPPESSMIASANTLGEGLGRGKFVPVGPYEVPLIVQLESTVPNQMQLCIQVFAPLGERCLPSGLALKILDCTGQVCLQAQARDQDAMLQLQCSGKVGEVFQVVLVYNSSRVAKTFMI
jgi:hypothetical protein